MAPKFRRGSAAIQEAAEKRGGDFRPFLPQVSWREDGESKYVLVLTDVQHDVALVLLHSFIPVGKGTKANGEEFTRYEDFISRRDRGIGEEHDDLEDRLQRQPRERGIGVMVELEPVLEANSKKVKGFVTKTETFTRQTDDGEVDVTAPVIGFCIQSPVTLWGAIDQLRKDYGDPIDYAIHITRRGKDKNTQYLTVPFLDKPVDLSAVTEYIDGINYLGDNISDVVAELESTEGEAAQAQVIGNFLLEKRLEELADPERYEELVSPLDLEDMPKHAWGRKQDKGKPSRPPRRSPREVTSSNGASEETETTTAKPSKSDRFAALKSRVEARG